MPKESQLPVQKPLSPSSKISKITPWTSEELSELAVAITHVFDLQKQFGKQASQLENIVKGFQWALKNYQPYLIIKAMEKYILTHDDMPTPYDLRQIIDPVKPRWQPDRAYYQRLKDLMRDRGNFALNSDEIEYIQQYEDFAQLERKSGNI